MIKDIKGAQVINFGCRLNSYESEVIKTLVKKNNIKNTFVFNTCSVTHEAEKQAQQAIRKYKTKNPESKIIVTGCAAQINPLKYTSMKEVDIVIGNNEKVNNATWANLNLIKKLDVKNIMEKKQINNHVVENFEGKARAYVEIQQGCDHRCTFCIIPFGRGNHRSVPINLIENRVKKLVSSGYKEIVFTGVDITSYGIDLIGKPSLSLMIKRILKLVPNLQQLRLSSIDCAEVDNLFWEILQYEDRFMPHLHISAQSGDDMILKRMKRRHTRKDAIQFCHKAKKIRPNIVLGADLIAGFPTEDDKMFNNTYNFVEECDLIYLHVFRYSQRNGTPAAKMPQIGNGTKKHRARILRNLGNSRLSNYLDTLVGKEKIALIEKSNDDISIGKTQEYIPIKIEGKFQEGELYKVKVKSRNKNILVA